MERAGLYAAVWRWHFYAGFLTLPFLVLLAATGSVYLFKDEINNWRYATLLNADPAARTPLAPSALVANAVTASGGTPTGYVPPAAVGRSARVVVETSQGDSCYVFVDPGDGRVLGQVKRGQFGNLPLMSFVRRLHSLDVAGWPGNRLIEIVAGWSVILVLTGAYLWWPRGRRSGVVSIRRHAGRRLFWRDLHAVTGIFAAMLIVFMALTGLPWSGVWGEALKAVLNHSGLGYPSGFWFPVARSSVPLRAVQAHTPWSFEDLPIPVSGSVAGVPLGIDDAVAHFDQAGMPPGYSIAFPRGLDGVWIASAMPDRVAGMRNLHIDQYTGDVLFDARYADLGSGARAVEWGISVHTGQEYGRANQLVMLFGCLSIVLMSVAVTVMWWCRRPIGSLGTPRASPGYRAPAGVLAIIVVAGAVFPLVGLSILVCLAIDVLMPNRWRTSPG